MAARARELLRIQTVTGKTLGIVEHGNPVPTNRIATDLGRSRDATLTNLERLETATTSSAQPLRGTHTDIRCSLLQGDVRVEHPRFGTAAPIVAIKRLQSRRGR